MSENLKELQEHSVKILVALGAEIKSYKEKIQSLEKENKRLQERYLYMNGIIQSLETRNAILKEACEKSNKFQHLDTCSLMLIESGACDCHRKITFDALKRASGVDGD